MRTYLDPSVGNPTVFFIEITPFGSIFLGAAYTPKFVI